MDRLTVPRPGDGMSARWAANVVEEIRRQNIIPGNGIKKTTSSTGTVLEIDTSVLRKSGGDAPVVSDIVPCVVDEMPEGSEIGTMQGIYVTLYPNGLLDQRTTEQGWLFLPEVTTHTQLPVGASILAHRCQVNYMPSDEEGDNGDNDDNGGS